MWLTPAPSEDRLAVHETTTTSLRAFDTYRASPTGNYSPRLQVSVLVVDTQALFRSGLARLLNEDDRLVVAGISDGGEDVASLCLAMSIDVVAHRHAVTGIGRHRADPCDRDRVA